jgi:hypothetical protein
MNARLAACRTNLDIGLGKKFEEMKHREFEG